MRQIDYIKLTAWLLMLLFCALFWGVIIKLGLGLHCLILIIVLIILIIRKLGENE